MSDFARASAIAPLGEGHFRADFPDGWEQGGGAFGGLVLATLARAMQTLAPDRPIRTLLGDLVGPVLPGPSDIRCRVLRRGKNQTNVAAELEQDGALLAIASAVLSDPRRVAEPSLALEPPPPARPSDLVVVTMPAPPAPVFTQHYEYRADTLPFGGAPSGAQASGFVRERTPLARIDAPALIGRLDAWWPTLFGLEPAPRPVATISFAAQIVIAPETLVPDEALRYRARMAALHDGFFLELRELWQGGRPVAFNQQTFAILK